MPQVTPRKMAVCAVSAVSLFALAGCGAEGGDRQNSAGFTEVKVASPANPPTVAAAFYTSLPQQTECAAEEELQWMSVPLGGSAPVMQALETGAVDAALAGSEAVIAAIRDGLDARIVYMAIDGNIQTASVLADSGIDSFDDFAGKTVGVLDLGAAYVPIIKATVADAGGDPEAVTFVQVKPGSPMIAALEQGRVDVLAVSDNYAATVEALGIDIRQISDERFEQLGATMALVVKNDLIEQDPDLVVRMARSIARCVSAAAQNPAKAVESHWNVYPETRGASGSDGLAVQSNVLAVRAQSMTPTNGVWGSTTDAKLQRRLDLAGASGVPLGDLTIEDIWTDEFLQQISDFDAAGGPVS